ncbi:sec-independent translocase [Streptomyces sp. NPDC052051]|uniref:sec-independent translocase n=1 Tax=Streptomyces sp. NPDC052051 TaxID=3154649 RepID=UPI00344107D1
MFFDMGPLKLITLVVLAALVFGPDKVPQIIQDVWGFLRKVRAVSESAKQDIRSELGPEFRDFEFEDLNPKTLVRKHMLDAEGLGLDEIRSALDPGEEFAQAADAVRESAGKARTGSVQAGRVSVAKTEQPDPAGRPAFDPDAT